MESLKNAKIVCCCVFAEVVPLWHTATKKIFMLPTRNVGERLNPQGEQLVVLILRVREF